MDVAGYKDKALKTTSLGFHLGPRINGAGRLETPDLALQLLRASSDGEAAQLADSLNKLNARRQALQREGMQEAESLVSPEDLDRDRVIVVLGEWKMGIVGLLASKLSEQHSRPAVVCTEDAGNGSYVGSARSIPSYDISQGISACSEYLATYGGHPAAAGFSLATDSFEAFRLALIEHANAHLSAEDMQPSLDIDLMLKPADLALRTVEQLAELEPFGNGHEPPVFGLDDCRVVSVRQIGKGGLHFKAELEAGGRCCAALWWNQGAQVEVIQPGQRLRAAFTLEEDTYAGNGAVQMVVKDTYSQENP